MRAAGFVLIVLGSMWVAVGAVLLVVSLVWSDPGSLPDWVDVGASDAATLGRLAVVGLTGVLAGAAQLASGLAVQRSSAGWPGWVGLGAALFGGLVTASWLISGLAQGLPSMIFLPVVAAYVYAAATLALRRTG